MSRNLLSSAVEYLASTSEVKLAHLVRLELAESTEANKQYSYLTDYMASITFGGNVYEAGHVTKLSDIRQGQGLTNYKLSVTVAGEFPEEIARGLSENSNTSYVGKDIQVLRAYLDARGEIVDFDDTNGDDMGTGGQPMKYFLGDITSIKIQEGVSTGMSAVTWECAGKFSDFSAVNGRTTNDTSHRGLETNPVTGVLEPSDGAKRVSHQFDTGFQHAAQTIDLVSSYLTTETRYKMKKRKWYQSDKLVSYEAEVEKTLELGIDLSAEFLPKVYGVRKIPGIPVFIDALKSDATKVYVVYAFSEGPIDSFLNFYLDGASLICSSTEEAATELCLGDQSNGDTLGAFISSNTLAEQNALRYEAYKDFIAENGGRGGQYLDPVPTQDNVSRTDGTIHTKVASGGNNKSDETVSYFSIDNSTGTKIITTHHGLSNQNANQELVDIAAAGNFLNQAKWAEETGRPASEYWDDNCKLLDTSYIVLQFSISEEETEMPEIEAVVSGSLVSTYANGVETKNVYTLNPVWHVLDYMTNTLCGGEVPITDINIDSFEVAAARLDVLSNGYSETWIDFWRYIGWKENPNVFPTNGQRGVMQCNMLINTEDTVTKNIENMLKQFDATINILGGKYHISMETDDDPIAHIDVSEVIGSIKAEDVSGKNKWNSIQAAIVDPSQGWTSNQINFFNSEFLEEDNGVKKKGSLSFAHITNYYTAREWAERQLKKSRFSRKITFTTYHKYLHLFPNANITFSYDRFWDAPKKFRVTATTQYSDGRVGLELTDYDSSIYNGSDSSQLPSAPITGASIAPPANLEYLPLPDARIDISTLVVDNVTGILLWDAPDTPYAVDRYEVRDWLELGDDYGVPPSQTVMDGSTEKNYILVNSLEPSKSYTFKVKTIGVSGSTSKYAVHTINTGTVVTVLAYSPIESFISTNTDESGDFTGGDLEMSWDLGTSVEGDVFEIAMYTTSPLTQVGTYTVDYPDNAFTYTFTMNKQDFADTNGGDLGAYREITAKIRVTNGQPDPSIGFRSSEWREINT